MKKFFLFITAFLVLLTVAGCSDKPGILFNREPITKENVMNHASLFRPGERIYYLLILPEKIRSRFVFIQIAKKGSADYGGYKLCWAKDIRLKDEDYNYYTDYVVLNQAGSYVMRVYSKDNPTKMLMQAQFFVR